MFLETYVVVASSAFGSAATLAGITSLVGSATFLRSSTALRSTSSLVGVIFVVIFPGVVLVGRGNLLHDLAVAVVAGDVDAGLGELLLDVGVRHEDDVAERQA